MMLLSFYFFVGTRFLKTAEVQRETTEYQNKKEYLESYADYIESLSAEELRTLDKVDLDEITGTLSRDAESISGFLEAKQSETFAMNGGVTVEWNKCEFGQNEELVINEELKRGPLDCGGGALYGNAEVVETSGELVLSAIGPAHYRLSGGNAQGGKWRLFLKTPLQYGEELEVERTFEK